MALSSSVSGLDVPLGAGGPDRGCSELELPPPLLTPQPGEDEVGGMRGGVGVDCMGQTGSMGESRGGVGGSLGGRGPRASGGLFICDTGCVSSGQTRNNRMSNEKRSMYAAHELCFTIDFIVCSIKISLYHSQLNVES